MFLLKCKQGFGYIQVLFASTAIAGLALLGMRLEKEQKAHVKKIYAYKLADYLTQEVRHVLSHPQFCQESLAGLSSSRSFVSHLKVKKDNRWFNIYERGKTYFDGAVLMEKLRVNGKKDFQSYKSKVTYLELTFKLAKLEGDVVVQREIPLQFSAHNDLIQSCHAVAVKSGRFQESWVTQDRGLRAKDKSFIGKKIVKLPASDKVSWDNYGPVKLATYDDSLLLNCKLEQKGVVSFSRQRGPVLCNGHFWQVLGHRELLWDETTSFSLTRQEQGSSTKVIKGYSFCYLTKELRKGSYDGCQLEYDKEKQVHSLTSFTSERLTKVLCEASCVR